ncbi:hypothetical protein Tco_0291813 [Tanacetum coccineum]
MNQEQIHQVTARDEKWVPAKERVKISTTNVRLEITVPQKEETFQVIIDVIKNSTCYQAFTVSAEKCLVDAEVFRKILDICPRVQGVDFTEVPDDETTLTFPIDLGYKGPLYNHPIIRGRGSQGNKEAISPKPISDEESDESDAKLARKRTGSRRMIKKKVSISVDDNIIPEPDIALELGKSMRLTEAAEKEAARQVHATHERIVTESDPEPARRISSGIAFRDTSRVSKKMSSDPSQKLKGTGVSLGVPDESTVILSTSSKGTGTKLGVLDEEKVTSETNVTLKWGSQQESEYTQEDDDDEKIEWEDTDKEEEKNDDDDDKSIDLKMTDNEFVHVNDEEDEEMTNAEDAEIRNGDEEIIDATMADANKTKEEKDDIKEAKFPPLSSSLSVSLGFGNQFLNLSSDKSTVGNLKDYAYAEINSLLDVQIQQEIPHIQSPSILTVLVSVISEPSVLTPILETPSVAPATTLLPPLSKYPQQVDYKEMIEESVQANLINEIKNQLPTLLPKAVSDSATLVIQSTIKNALDKTPLLTILFEKMDKIRSYLTHDKHQAYFDAFLNLMSLDDAIAGGKADPEKVLRKRDRDDEDPSAGPNQGKKTKRSRTKEFEPSKKSSTSKKSSKGKSSAKTFKSGKSVIAKEPDKDPKKDWFKQPPRPPTPDPKWNKRQVVVDQPEQPWFNQMVSISKDPLSFDKLMATSIDFSKYAMNRLKIDNLNQAHLNNPEGDRRPFDLTKPLSLKGHPGRLTVAAEYFFNNDLEFLKSSDPENKYTTSITKTKVARYEIVGIEDMVSTLWSATKVGYDKDVLKGIKHWDDKLERLHGYSHLDEIVVKRADRQLYKFKEGDFVDLHLNDIEDMLFLAVQHKLFHLNGSDIVDFIMALWVIYKDLNKQKRVMRADELYKFSDETLKTIRDELHHGILNFCLGYNKEINMRKWSAIDKRRSKLMVELIDKQMRERRIIRNLERVVGARELEIDYKLMTRTE